MSAVLLWIVGGFFLLAAPFIKSSNGEAVGRIVQLVFVIVGALCWRFA